MRISQSYADIGRGNVLLDFGPTDRITTTKRNQLSAAVVTGASSGIGRACALTLDNAGYRVFATARQAQDAESLRLHASDYLAPLMMDVTDRGMVQRRAANGAVPMGHSRRLDRAGRHIDARRRTSA